MTHTTNTEFKNEVRAILAPAFTKAFSEVAKRGYDIRAAFDKTYDEALQIKASKFKAA